MRVLPLLLLIGLAACASSPSKPRIALTDLVGLPGESAQQAFGGPAESKPLENGDVEWRWNHSEEKKLDAYLYDSTAPKPPNHDSFFKNIANEFVDSLTYTHDPEPGDTIEADCDLVVTTRGGAITAVDTDYDDNFNNMKKDLPGVCDHYEDVLQDYYDQHPDFLNRGPVAVRVVPVPASTVPQAATPMATSMPVAPAPVTTYQVVPATRSGY